MKKIIKIGLIHTINNGRDILCVKKRGLDLLISPGGKIQENEDPYTCLNRELTEELFVKLDHTVPIHYYMICRGIAEGTTDTEIELIMYKGSIDRLMPLIPSNEIEYYAYLPIREYASLPLAWSLKREILPALYKEWMVQ